jgi:6-phosphogluconate dehydrogenase (decarboxylating)
VSTPDIKRVGLIGLGKMGLPMGRLLHQRGFTVSGYDVALAAIKTAAAAGIRPVNSPKAVAAASDLVIVAVGFDAEVEAVLFGDNGVLAGAGDGSVIAIASTIAPHSMQGIAARLKDRPGITLLDIPLCRGEGAAQEGKLLIMGGGDKAAFDACRAAFAAFADAVFHLGPVGAGQVGKMVNNLILWACISANEEGFKLARPRRRARNFAGGAARLERQQLVAGDAAGGKADALGGKGHDHRAQGGRRGAPEPAAVRRGQGGDQGREDRAQLADAARAERMMAD